MKLEFIDHPEVPGKRVCTLAGCQMGGIGDTDEQAFQEFVHAINLLQVAVRMTEQAVAVACGKIPPPGARPKPQSNLILPAHMATPTNLNIKG